MEVKKSAFLANIQSSLPFSFLILAICALTGCAASGFSRDAASTVDNTYYGAASLGKLADSNLPSAYNNSSQVAQSAVVGAITGAAIVGYASGSMGILPGAAGGAVLGGAIGAYIEHHSNLLDKIYNRGGKVFVIGDHIMIVLPSAQIFRGMTGNILPEAYPTLDAVATIIRSVTSMSVKVATYSCGDGARQVEYALTQQQANSVVKYLWPKIDTRVLSASGRGNSNLVDAVGSGANYRIEITLEKLPV